MSITPIGVKQPEMEEPIAGLQGPDTKPTHSKGPMFGPATIVTLSNPGAKSADSDGDGD